MTQRCNVCTAPLGGPVYRSPENASITTMNRIIPGRTEVYFCDACGHLQTTPLPNLAEYYASEYAINLASDDDDQLYKVVDGVPVYRAEHQASVLLAKVPLAAGMRVLDYGCAKAATLRKVLAQRPGIVPYAFDVTDRYVPFWERFVAAGHFAAHEVPAAWSGEIDVVLSFYSLEHADDLAGFLGRTRRLLKSGGVFYLIVPNAYANVADFVVADHVNHFSEPSLRAMLARAGFADVDVDAQAHDAAFVVTARAHADPSLPEPDPSAIRACRQQAVEMADFWQGAANRVAAFEASLPKDAARAIYGAGFYGNYIASALREPDAVTCFVDQNAHLQGRTMLGKPVVAPGALPPAVKTVFVGLNPRHAREVIDGIAAWRDARPRCFFL